MKPHPRKQMLHLGLPSKRLQGLAIKLAGREQFTARVSPVELHARRPKLLGARKNSDVFRLALANPMFHCASNRSSIGLAAQPERLRASLRQRQLCLRLCDGIKQHPIPISTGKAHQPVIDLEVHDQQEVDLGRLGQGPAQCLAQAHCRLQLLCRIHDADEEPLRARRHVALAVEAAHTAAHVRPRHGHLDVVVPEAASPTSAAEHDILVLDLVRGIGQEVLEVHVRTVNDALERRPHPVEGVRAALEAEQLQRVRSSAEAAQAYELASVRECRDVRARQPKCCAATELHQAVHLRVDISGAVQMRIPRHHRSAGHRLASIVSLVHSIKVGAQLCLRGADGRGRGHCDHRRRHGGREHSGGRRGSCCGGSSSCPSRSCFS
mmetsp:Transcript_129533/g.415274  ORF Transcript_129533/g.415274 Transcript_129533/m.415274 type:complete len:380 (+) Transcript_129533:437-1576(+)